MSPSHTAVEALRNSQVWGEGVVSINSKYPNWMYVDIQTEALAALSLHTPSYPQNKRLGESQTGCVRRVVTEMWISRIRTTVPQAGKPLIWLVVFRRNMWANRLPPTATEVALPTSNVVVPRIRAAQIRGDRQVDLLTYLLPGAESCLES